MNLTEIKTCAAARVMRSVTDQYGIEHLVHICPKFAVMAYHNIDALIKIAEAAKKLSDNTDECGDSPFEMRFRLHEALLALELPESK